MKKQYEIVIAVVVVIAIVAIFAIVNLTGNAENNGGDGCGANLNITPEEAIQNVYDKTNMDDLPRLSTTSVDLEDLNSVTYYTGLTSTDGIDAIAASEPMMSSQAYSFVTIKVKDGADINAIKQSAFENVNQAKWICVMADEVYVANAGNMIYIFMAQTDWTEAVLDGLKETLNIQNSDMLTK